MNRRSLDSPIDEGIATPVRNYGDYLSALIRKTAADLGLLSGENDLVATMDSLDMVNLFVELERAFGRPIPPEIISPAAFGSVATLARTLEDLFQGDGAA